MYLHTGEGPGSKRKQRAYDTETFLLQLPPHLRRDFPECEVFDSLVSFNASVDRKLSESCQVWHGMFATKKREGGMGPNLRTLRMCVYNTHVNQYGSYATGKTGSPSWTLRVEGMIMGEKPNDLPKFSHFIKHLSIELDKRVYKNDNFIEWDNRRHVGDSEGFEVTRIGHSHVKCKIIVEINYPTQLYKLSPEVQSLVRCASVQTHDNVIRAFFMYCKEQKLEKDYETENIICDDKLRNLFNVDSFSFADLPRLIRPHLLTPPPLEIDYTIDVSKTPEETAQVYDIIVQEPDVAGLRKLKESKEIVALDRQVSNVVKKIAVSSKRHKFLKSFAADPAGFLHTMIRSDARDTEFMDANTLTKESAQDPGYFENEYVLGAARQYLLNEELKRKQAPSKK